MKDAICPENFTAFAVEVASVAMRAARTSNPQVAIDERFEPDIYDLLKQISDLDRDDTEDTAKRHSLLSDICRKYAIREAAKDLIRSYGAATYNRPLKGTSVLGPVAFISEIDGIAAGVCILEGDGLRFFTTDERFGSLNGRQFRDARQLERAAQKILEASSTWELLSS